jgi:hypothetical protein
MTDSFKKAAIDFVLTHGECDSMTTSTSLALADLTVRGLDYERSEMPDFRNVALDAGDSFHSATYGEAFACDVYALGADPENWRDVYTFHIGDQDLKRILLHQVITGVVAAAEHGDAGWTARANERHVERLTLSHTAKEA